MNKYVADTMAIVLYLENRRLPHNVKTIFNHAANGIAIIYCSAVSLMEIGYLSEKKRIDISLGTILQFSEMNKNFILHNLDEEVIVEAFKIKGIPELHDRLITATASILKADLLTNDPIITKANYVKVIW